LRSIEILIAGKYEGAALTPEMLSVTDDIEKFLFQFPEVISVMSPSKVIKKLNQSIHNDSLEYYLIPDSKELIAQYLLLASSAGKDPLEHYINFEETTSRVTARIKNVGSNRVKHILDDLDVFLSQNTLDKFEVKTTGTTKLVQRVNNQISISLTSSLVLAIGIIALLMGLLFRSFRFMIISMIPNILPLILIAGTMGWLGIRLRLSTAAVFCVAFGIAVDDTIHFLSRVKIEMREGSSLAVATQKSLVHTGKAIIATSIVLIAGFSVLLSSKFQSSFDFGLLTALTIFFALVSDLYLLPIMINRFGHKLDKTKKNKN
jgi:predicted RND superfamily exporter protein